MSAAAAAQPPSPAADTTRLCRKTHRWFLPLPVQMHMHMSCACMCMCMCCACACACAILRLTTCPQVDKGSGHMWREEQRLASRRRHSPRSTTHLRRLAAVRWISPRRSSEQLQREITALLRYCGSRDRVAALLRLRSALVLCSPRPHREFAVPTTTSTFLPSALSHLRGYVHCVSV